MVIDTINDVVIGDIGDEIVNTSGVAVRPFWWSTECLEVLGVASASGDPGETDVTDGDGSGAAGGSGADGGSDTAGGETVTSAGSTSDEGGTEGPGSTGKAGGLAGGWIALVVVLAVLAVGGVAGVAFLLGRGRRTAVTPAAEIASSGTGGVAAAGGASTEAAEPPSGSSAPRFCSGCGGPLAPGVRFCPSCGKES